MTDDKPWVNVSIDIWGADNLSREDLWPDDDSPERPTADDVVALIKEAGGLRRVLSDWDLLSGATVTVGVGGESVASYSSADIGYFDR